MVFHEYVYAVSNRIGDKLENCVKIKLYLSPSGPISKVGKNRREGYEKFEQCIQEIKIGEVNYISP